MTPKPLGRCLLEAVLFYSVLALAAALAMRLGNPRQRLVFRDIELGLAVAFVFYLLGTLLLVQLHPPYARTPNRFIRQGYIPLQIFGVIAGLLV